jgi:cytochrome P450
MTRTMHSSPLEGFDPLSPGFLDDPHAFWQSVGERPVFFHEPMHCWVLSRHEHIAAALRDWQSFSSRTLRAAPLPRTSWERVPEEVRAIPPRLIGSAFINVDPPHHTVDRKATQKAFTRPLVTASESLIRQLANDRIDGFVAQRRCELMGDFCHPLSLSVIVRMVGLPAETLSQFRGWIDDFFGIMAPSQGPDDADAPLPCTPEELEGRYLRLGEAYAFFNAYLDDRRANPQDDLASAMVHATGADGQPAMSYEQVLTHTLELAAAGSDTTANLIAHMVRHFSAHPEDLREILDDPRLWENAVEEGLRRWAIVTNLVRRATADVEIDGVKIPAGSVMLLNLPGANGDDRQFADPLRFDLHRENADDHLAFGVGRHFCLGAPLARLEARSALQELYRRIPDITVDPAEQQLDYHAAVTVRGLKRLAVSWDATTLGGRS